MMICGTRLLKSAISSFVGVTQCADSLFADYYDMPHAIGEGEEIPRKVMLFL